MVEGDEVFLPDFAEKSWEEVYIGSLQIIRKGQSIQMSGKQTLLEWSLFVFRKGSFTWKSILGT